VPGRRQSRDIEEYCSTELLFDLADTFFVARSVSTFVSGNNEHDLVTLEDLDRLNGMAA